MRRSPVRITLDRLGLKPFARRVFVALIDDTRVLSIDGTEATFYREDFGDHIELNRIGTERKILRRLRRDVRPDDVFLDVGSNLGVFSVFVGDVIESGHVIAVEPVPSTAEKLGRNLDMNGVDATVANVAFSATNGTVSLTVPDAHGSSAIETAGDGASRNPEVAVESVRGDDYLDRRGLSMPTVLKIDVEGYEYSVLRGLQETMSRPRCRLVYCEVHADHMARFDASPEDVHEKLHSCGFEPNRILDLPGNRYVLRASRE